MRLVTKGPPPRAWSDYRKQNPAPAGAGPQAAKDWSKQHWGSASKTPAATKAALRRALVVEQRGLCAYCLGGISLRGSGDPPPPESADHWETAVRGSRLTVEHWRARETFPLECLEYELLLGVCSGGTETIATNTDPRQLHCDKRRLSADLSLSPLSPSQMALTRYRTGGRVEWPDDALNREANEVLGLNTPALVRARDQFLTSALRETSELLGGKRRGWNKRDLAKAVAHWASPRPGGDRPYVDVILRYLRAHHGWAQ